MRVLPTLLLLPACGLFQIPEPGETPDAAIAYLRAIGDAIIRVDGTAAIVRYAPEVMTLIDTNPKDNVVTLAEVEAVLAQASDPAQLTWLILMARGIYESRKEQ